MRLSSSILPLSRILFGTALVMSLCPITLSKRITGCHLSYSWRTFVHEERKDCVTSMPISKCSGVCYSETSYDYDMVTPMAKQRCGCCRPSGTVKILPTRLNFRCRNGDILREKVWYHRATGCSCFPCSSPQLTS